MPRSLCLLVVTSAILAGCFSLFANAQSFDSVHNDLLTLMASVTNVYGAAVVTQNPKGYLRVSTGAVGLSNPLTGAQMMTDTSVVANTAGELFLSMLAVNLSKRGFLPLLDQSIDSSLLPCSLVNPNNLGSYLTLRRLLTHTSGLDEFSSQFSASSSSVGNLRSFALSYFTLSGSSGLTCQPNLFRSAGSYFYSRANLLLVSYIIEMTISSNLLLVQGSQKTVGAMMQESIFNLLGLDGTYFVLPDGTNPRRLALGDRDMQAFQGMQQFDAKAVQEMSSQSSAATTLVFAGYTTGLMLRTTASDLAKVTRSLFIDSTSPFYSVGQVLQSGFINVTDSNRPGMVQQGLGVVMIDSGYICRQGSNALYLGGGCSLGMGSMLMGVVATGQSSALSSLCTTTSSSRTCTSAVLAYSKSSTASRSFTTLDTASSTTATAANTLFALTTSAANNVLISPLLSQGTTITADDQATTPIFGFEVFVAIFLSFIAVLALAYFAEYFVQPVPLVGHLSSKAYPTLSEHIDRSMNAIS